MAHKDAEIAIEARLRANWTHCEIFTENVEDSQLPESDASYIQLQFPYSSPSRWSVGTRLYREEGGFRIVFAIPRGEGVAKLRTWGEEMRDLFLDVSFEGVNCRVPSDPSPDDRNGSGPYYIASMVIPYDYNWRKP